jgi:hypothetical protein
MSCFLIVMLNIIMQCHYAVSLCSVIIQSVIVQSDIMQSVIMQSVIMQCHYAECHYAECHGTKHPSVKNELKMIVKKFC